jgi:hypothetical protein
MRRHLSTSILVFSLACTVAACASRPRQRPLQTSPVNEGADTMSAVRDRLNGKWELLSLTVNTMDGRAERIDATGVLTADAFGGLDVEYRISDTGQQSLAKLGIKPPSPVIATSGSVVINPQSKEITYIGEDFNKRALSFDKELAALRANPFALERVRYYTFGADGTLTLATRYENGKDAAVGHWKKSS